MTATYEPSLPTDRDWLRLTIGDTATASALLQDEEIDAVLTEEANKHLAAAESLSILRTRWNSQGAGVLTKQVSKLRISYGTDSSAAEALDARIKQLRARGAYLLSPTPGVLKVL